MFITIYAAGMPFDGETIPSGKSLGGSESAAYYIAKELQVIGHKVTVFTSKQISGTWDGVKYEFIGEVSEQTPLGDRFQFYVKAPQDVCIIQRHPLAFTFPVNSKLNIWWLHDLALKRNLQYIQQGLVNIDRAFTVSEFHKNQVAEVYGIQPDYIYATKNGMDYDSVTDYPAGRQSRISKQVLFCSRPERGLAEIVEQGGLADLLPDYKFLICGYDNTTPQMVNFYNRLYGLCDQRPNVERLGYLGKSHLWDMMQKCMAVVYPTMFEDTSNMVAIEAAANGTPFIGVKNAALPETCRGGFAKLVPQENGCFDLNDFAGAVRDVCESQIAWTMLHEAGKKNRQAWSDIAKDWDQVFRMNLADKCNDPIRLIKHYEQQSDVVAMMDFAEKKDLDIEDVLPDFKTNYRFLLEHNFANHYDAYYEYEKNRGVNYGPESLDGNSRFECTFDIVRNSKPLTVLDYGCAHGHYTINLGKRLGDVGFLGVDINKRNIDIARKWAEDENVSNVNFLHGIHIDISSGSFFDLIIIAEVLEHVEDPAELVQYLHDNHLSDGGRIVISTPYGPWEAIGYQEHKGWRAHIHHFERQDIIDMFSHFDDFKNTALPNSENLGHYIYSFSKTPGAKVGVIDYDRKHRQQAPRETISLCMIVRDAEDTIGKCLKGILPNIDELVIGLDDQTQDSTIEIVKNVTESLNKPCKILPIQSPVDQGFDAARNATIAEAVSDWIAWLDDDESFENLDRLAPYLRNNHYNGYMICQHHFSAEPAGLIQTDLPTRIFRNHKDIKFFGRVHEHPCQDDDYNKGIVPTYQIDTNTLAIMHTGYSTETKRRKRWARNYPLLKWDRKDHPNRMLGKFLYMRDISHDIRYRRERLRGGIDQTCFDLAKQAVELWEDLLSSEDTHGHYLINGLSYYSECAQILGNGNSIPFKFSISGHEIQGLFHSPDVIKALMTKITNQELSIYEGKYF